MAATPSTMVYQPELLRALREGYGRGDLLADLAAGALVGVVALPLSMALAIASGVKPEQGLFTAIVGGLLISALGGSRMQVGGPAGAFVGLCAASVNQFGYGGLALATLMAGGLMLFMGLMRLGKAITFVPTPVVIGFTTGIALILASTQLVPALGLPEPAKAAEHLHERVLHVRAHLAGWRWEAATLAIATVALIVGLRRWAPRLPGPMLAILAVSVAAWALGWRVETIGSRFGELPRALPLPALPDFGLPPDWHLGDLIARMSDLAPTAVALALLGSIESLLSAVVADGMTGHRHHSNTELIGQGVANLATPFFLGLPATGVIARTSANIRAGARSPVAGIVHALTVLAIMVVAAPLVVHVPLAALAGVLLVVCWSMAELRHWPHILRAGRSDAFLLPLAFVLTAFFGLTQAILVGVALAMFFFVQRMTDATTMEKAADGQDDLHGMRIPRGVEVYEVRGPFFFGAATLIRDLASEAGARPLVTILRLGHVPFIDATAGFALRELATACRKHGGRLLLADAHTRPLMDLQRLGLLALIGEDNVRGDLASALTRAETLVAEAGATRRSAVGRA